MDLNQPNARNTLLRKHKQPSKFQEFISEDALPTFFVAAPTTGVLGIIFALYSASVPPEERAKKIEPTLAQCVIQKNAEQENQPKP